MTTRPRVVVACSAESPSLVRASGSAPAPSRALTIPISPSPAATRSAESPSFVTAFGLAPASSSVATTSACPASTAKLTACRPSPSARPGSAPASRSMPAIPARPAPAATCSAVRSSLVSAFGLAPAPNRAATMSPWPSRAAMLGHGHLVVGGSGMRRRLIGGASCLPRTFPEIGTSASMATRSRADASLRSRPSETESGCGRLRNVARCRRRTEPASVKD